MTFNSMEFRKVFGSYYLTVLISFNNDLGKTHLKSSGTVQNSVLCLVTEFKNISIRELSLKSLPCPLISGR